MLKQIVVVMSFVFSLFFVTESLGQTYSTSKKRSKRRYKEPVVKILPHVGYSAFTYAGDQTATVEYRHGINAGMLVDIGRRNVVFETGLMYLQMGAGTDSPNAGVFESLGQNNLTSANILAEYIALPVLVKLYTGRRHNGFFLKAGVMGAGLMNAEAEGSLNGQFTSLDVASDVRLFDLLAVGGLGGQFWVTRKGRILLEATFNRGLVQANEFGNPIQYNQGFMISGGLAISL